MRTLLFLIFIYCGLAYNARSDSFFYPLAAEVTINTVPGRPVFEVIESFYRSMRSDAYIEDINVRENSRALVKTDDPEFARVCCSEKRQYKGPLGEVLFELLSEYGCGYQIEDPQRSDGPPYTLILRRADPSKVFSISIPPPKAWQDEIANHQGTFEQFLGSKGARLDGLSKLDSYHFRRNIYASGSWKCMLGVWYAVTAAQVKDTVKPGGDGKAANEPSRRAHE